MFLIIFGEKSNCNLALSVLRQSTVQHYSNGAREVTLFSSPV